VLPIQNILGTGDNVSKAIVFTLQEYDVTAKRDHACAASNYLDMHDLRN